MSRFALTAAAQADLSAIAVYNKEQWGERQASAYLDALERGLTQLALRPLAGGARDELAEALRSHPLERHIAYFRPQHAVSRYQLAFRRSQALAVSWISSLGCVF